MAFYELIEEIKEDLKGQPSKTFDRVHTFPSPAESLRADDVRVGMLQLGPACDPAMISTIITIVRTRTILVTITKIVTIVITKIIMADAVDFGSLVSGGDSAMQSRVWG